MPTLPNRFSLFFSLFVALMILPMTGCQSAANQNLYVSTGTGKTLHVYDLNPASGQLTLQDAVGLEGPAGPIAMAPDNQTLYVALSNPERVAVYSRDPETGELEALGSTPIKTRAVYLDIDKLGRHALIASYGEGLVASYRIGDNGLLLPEPVQTVATAKNAHACLIDPSNNYVFVPHTGPNAIYQFVFNQISGKLTPNRPGVVQAGGTEQNPQGPRHYIYHPDLPMVYMVNELDSSVSAYAFDPWKGTLDRVQSLSTLPEDFNDKNTCADIHITPNGRFLYASNRGHDSIAAYEVHPTSGIIQRIGMYPTEQTPREFEIDLTGKYLYAAGMKSNKLAAYEINPKTGELIRIGTYATAESPRWVTAVEKD